MQPRAFKVASSSNPLLSCQNTIIQTMDLR